MTTSQWLRIRPGYANVASTLALALVVGGGTAYAAGLAPKSVDTRHLVGKAVTTQKLAGDAVTGTKVADGSLGLQELATLPLSATTVRSAYLMIPASPNTVYASRNVQCEPGETVLSGGFDVTAGAMSQDDIEVGVVTSRPVAGAGSEVPTPTSPATGWRVSAVAQAAPIVPREVMVYVVCGS